MDQSLKTCLVFVLLSAIYVGVSLGDGAGAVNQQQFWQTMLPNTPMPRALINALPKTDSADGTKDANKAIFQELNGQTPLSETLSEIGYAKPPPTELLHQDAVTSIFFLEKDLKTGTKMNIHFTNKMQGTQFPFSPIEQKMPSLNTKNLPQLLELFSISPNSKTANVINKSIVRCEHHNPINGRVQFCATSLEKLVTQVTSELGNSQNIKAVSMPDIHTDALIPYKIKSVQNIAEERSMIACHKLSFPVGVYYCHQPRGAVAYAVSLVGQDRAVHDTYALCHRDTSDWSPEYIAFKVLGVSPGATVCHFNQPDNVIWYRG